MDNQFEEKKEIPTPPPSKVNVRTMQSDIKSIQESGGQNPQPYMTEINQPKKETSAPEEISFQPSELGPNIPGYVGPEEPIFKPGVPIAPLPPQQKPNKPEEGAKPPKKDSKTLIIIILVILVLAAIILGAGYYLTKKEKAVSVTPTPTPPTVTPPVTPPKNGICFFIENADYVSGRRSCCYFKCGKYYKCLNRRSQHRSGGYS